MKRILLAITLSVAIAVGMPSTGNSQTAQPVIAADSFKTYTYNSFLELYNRGVQEKIYIQTDKPYYSAGDKIWFKGYVVNAITNIPSTASKFIYAELINRNDSLVQRVKIIADSSGFHNNIALDPALPQGEYTLRAYTRWMRNEDDKFFFYKRLKIANPIDDAVNANVSYSRDDQNKIVAAVTLRDQSLSPLSAQRLSYTINVDGQSKRHNARTDDNGVVNIVMDQPSGGTANNSINIVSTDPNRKFERTIFLPLFSNKFDMQFFPESGHLVPGQVQIVAFKAIGSDGLAREIEGKLFSSDSTYIGDFATTHKGMGKLSLLPEIGKSYYAEVKLKNGTPDANPAQIVNLPAVTPSGCAIKVAQFRNRVFFQTILTPDIDPSMLGIVIHTKGRIITAENVSADKLSKSIESSYMPEGVSQIALIDRRTAQPLAQRAFFVRQPSCESSISADKEKYGRREAVVLDIIARNGSDAPTAGSFAVSVTDRNSVELDTLADNIVSYLSMSSDIRGYVEDPASYFLDRSALTIQNLDLLMMTQGWTRFDIGEVMTGKIATKTITCETEESIVGEVKGFFGNAAKSPTILVFNPKANYFDMFPLPGTNKFTISGIDYPDSTSLMIQAVSKSGGGKTLTLDITPVTYPTVKSYLNPRILGDHELQLPSSFVSQSKEKYYYEGGMRVIDIDAITVTKQVEKRSTMYNMTPTRSMSKADLEHFANMSIKTALSTFPGVMITGDNISIRGSHDQPLVFVDEVPSDIEYIDNISMTDVESLDLVVGPEAGIFGLGASGGVILIGLKSGASVNARAHALLSLANITRLGYKKPEAFFQPKYEVLANRDNKTPDLRTTIYWNPTIVTDSTGTARVTFFTADKTGMYDVVLEGVAADGSLIHQKYAIKREE